MRDTPLQIEKLVHPAWLNSRIARVELQLQHQLLPLIIDVGDGALDVFHQGHIPSAIHLDTNDIERPPAWNLIPDGELEQVLLVHGITAGQTAVLYGQDPIAVARAVWTLMYAGVRDVRWLAGGIDAWQAAGYELESGEPPIRPAASFGGEFPAHPEYLIDLAGTQAILAEQNGVVVCTRSWKEFTGQVSGYDFLQAKGRIPGSIWAGFPYTGLRPAMHSHSPEEAARLCQALAADWQAKGITPDRKVIFYCGTGWRASEAFFYAHLVGWKDICVYDGGWLEWSSQEK